VQSESVAKILLFNEKGEILLLQTGVHKLRPEKSHSPDLPGGMVDFGESELAGVVREVQEETGIVLDPDSVILGHADTQMYGNKSVTKLLYVATLAATPDVVLSWEHETYEWCSVQALLDNDAFRSTYRHGVQYLRNNQLV
jgi:8-oxo-dGTP pyrophosphatase MutT (NUDIX family)